ncbi:MAG TPA: hypothetical protein VK586_01890 [Streptosporangiaceae bacterium]|nr:hypothetical protein [Streptosporangiaceae bacterium]
MQGTPISEDEFGELLVTFRVSAFRLETRDRYALAYEQADFDAFLAGNPVPPPAVRWWRPWLDQISRLTADGRQIGRVRILAEPPSDYQQWELWAAPWHSAAGEKIAYMSRRVAAGIGLPADGDWWLLDGERLIIMGFGEDGEITGKMLVTDSGAIAQYREWQHLAVCYATPAEEFTAA